MKLDTISEKEIEETIEQKSEPKEKRKAKRMKEKKKKTIGQKLFLVFKIMMLFIILGIIGIYIFFKTDLFQEYKELWVQTAMTTMNHQYLATWFLSEEEIAEIMKKLEVENNENSNINDIMVVGLEEEKKEITVEKITGKGYVGFVMQVPDSSKVKLVDGRQAGRGSKLSEIVKKNNAIGGINAGGFEDPDGKGSGHILNDAVIMNKKLLYGNKATRYTLIRIESRRKINIRKI